MQKFLIVAALLLLALPVTAQNDLSYGSTVVGQTDTVYNMSGKAGELLVAEAFGITPGLTPRLILTLGTDPNPIAVSESLQPGSTTLTYRLPQDSSYHLKVDGHGTSGQFVLALEHSPAETPVPLADQTTLPTGSYTFNAPAELHLSGSGWIAEIRDAFGQIVARVSSAPSANMLIGASGTYELAILSGTVTAEYHPRPDLAAASAPTATEQATASSKLARSSARRQPMTYGSAVRGKISTAGGTASFPFTGKAGDLVFARVLPVSDGLEAALSVVAPDGSPAVSSVGGALTDRLASSGPYVLVVTAQSGTSGDFVVRLDAQTGRLLPLSLGQLTSAQFLVGGAPQVYHFEQNPTVQLLLTLSADNPAFRFSSTVRSHDGESVAYFNGEMRSVVLTLDPGAGSFDLTLTPDDPAAQGLVLIDLETNEPPGSATRTPVPASATPTSAPATATATRTSVPPSATPTRTPVPATPTRTPVPASATATFTPIPASPTPAPASATLTPMPASATSTPVPASATPTPMPTSASSTPTLTSQAVPGAVYCHVSTNGTANIRSAPNTSAPVIERLTRSQSVDVIGLSADGGWYAVRLATQVGWVSTVVVREVDPCVNVPPLSP